MTSMASESTGAESVGGEVIRTAQPLFVRELAHVRPDGETAPVFVLLHGYAATSYSWRHWAPRLAERGRVFLVDLKGFGDAPKPDDGRYSPADQAGFVVAFMKEQALENVTLIGHSMGGGIALLTVLELLDAGDPRIQRLILVAAAALRQRLPPFVALARRPRLSTSMLRLIGAELVVRVALRQCVYARKSVGADQVTEYARALATKDGIRAALDVGRQILPANIDEITRRYPEITVPTLLLWGDHDRVIPLWVGEKLAETLPSARLEVLERCGHMPPEELPDESWGAVERFLSA